MVNVEQDTLRTFKQDALTIFTHLIKHVPNGIEIRQHRITHGHQFITDLLAIEFWLAKTREQRIVMHQQTINLALQFLGACQIDSANGAAANFVFIGGPDAATCGADFG